MLTWLVGDGVADLVLGAGQGEEALERCVNGQVVIVKDVAGCDVITTVV